MYLCKCCGIMQRDTGIHRVASQPIGSHSGQVIVEGEPIGPLCGWCNDQLDKARMLEVPDGQG